MITIEEGIKQEIAERVASSTTPGYSTALHGQWFVVDGEAVVHRASNAPWNPWLRRMGNRRGVCIGLCARCL